MKNKLVLIFAALIMTFGLAAVSSAQTYHRYYNHNINARERHQQERIAEGIENGRLTPREASRLERDEVRVDRTEARLRRSGGRLTPYERARLERDLNHTSRQIYRQKHDWQGYPR